MKGQFNWEEVYLDEEAKKFNYLSRFICKGIALFILLLTETRTLVRMRMHLNQQTDQYCRSIQHNTQLAEI